MGRVWGDEKELAMEETGKALEAEKRASGTEGGQGGRGPAGGSHSQQGQPGLNHTGPVKSQ